VDVFDAPIGTDGGVDGRVLPEWRAELESIDGNAAAARRSKGMREGKERKGEKGRWSFLLRSENFVARRDPLGDDGRRGSPRKARIPIGMKHKPAPWSGRDGVAGGFPLFAPGIQLQAVSRTRDSVDVFGLEGAGTEAPGALHT